MIFDPIHNLPLIGRKVSTLDQAPFRDQYNAPALKLSAKRTCVIKQTMRVNTFEIEEDIPRHLRVFSIGNGVQASYAEQSFAAHAAPWTTIVLPSKSWT